MYRKAFFTVTDYWKTADPKKESIIPLVVTQVPSEALTAVKKAVGQGRIHMREDDGIERNFLAADYNAAEKALKGHRFDAKGSDRWHGFIEYCEEHRYASPVIRRKKVKKAKKAIAKV